VTGEDAAQAALVGFAISDRFEIVFDTLAATRKAQNLRANPKIALVIGGWVADDERTVQYEGEVDEPTGEEMERVRQVYYTAYPDGPSRANWPGLIYFRVKPRWIRYSDYNRYPPEIVEFGEAELVE
jgi:uncharacterized protein YhbP (UPF0306 family)